MFAETVDFIMTLTTKIEFVVEICVNTEKTDASKNSQKVLFFKRN